jgi:hypothetical protein
MHLQNEIGKLCQMAKLVRDDVMNVLSRHPKCDGRFVSHSDVSAQDMDSRFNNTPYSTFGSSDAGGLSATTSLTFSDARSTHQQTGECQPLPLTTRQPHWLFGLFGIWFTTSGVRFPSYLQGPDGPDMCLTAPFLYEVFVHPQGALLGGLHLGHLILAYQLQCFRRSKEDNPDGDSPVLLVCRQQYHL